MCVCVCVSSFEIWHTNGLYVRQNKIVCIHNACMIRESMATNVNERKNKTDRIYSRRLFFTDVNIFRRILDGYCTPTGWKYRFLFWWRLTLLTVLMLSADLYTQCCCACALFKTNNFDIRFWPKNLIFFFQLFLLLYISVSVFFFFILSSFGLFSLLFSVFKFKLWREFPLKKQIQIDCNTDM